MKDLSDALTNPEGWEENVFGLVHPPYRVEIWVQPISGFEIRRDKAYRYINGEKVEQTGWDALRLRAEARAIFGEDIADAAGIEP